MSYFDYGFYKSYKHKYVDYIEDEIGLSATNIVEARGKAIAYLNRHPRAKFDIEIYTNRERDGTNYIGTVYRKDGRYFWHSGHTLKEYPLNVGGSAQKTVPKKKRPAPFGL